MHLAFNLSVAAFHIADIYYQYRNRRDPEFGSRYRALSQFQDEIATAVGSFRVIQGMANAYKHLHTSSIQAVATTGAVTAMEAGGIEAMEGEDLSLSATFGESGGKGDIAIDLRDGSTVLFSGAIDELRSYWKQRLEDEAHADWRG